jgi:GNAT superfamily N-acetyltransferase
MTRTSSVPLTLALEASPEDATIRAIEAGLDAYNALQVGPADWSPHWVVGRDEVGAVQAGMQYVIAYEWLFVRWLWVAEAYRKQGIGSHLIECAEAAANQAACRGLYLDTFTFQAPKFYERHGFREFGRIDGFPHGHSRIWLAKRN